MARMRPKDEMPPENWQPTQAVDDPIINNPYDEPKKHYSYKDGKPIKIEERRPASYWYKTKLTDSEQRGLFQEEESEALPLVNALRTDVKRWRESGYRGASKTTQELLGWWMRDDRPRRLFFCQRESVETFIYLLELAMPSRLSATGFKNFEAGQDTISSLLKGERPASFEGTEGSFFPKLIDAPWDASLLPLTRMGCKMATGSGKTIVMAMIIAWAFCNRGRNPLTKQYPNAVLVCAPNLTVKKRLQVLLPENPHNYYDEFDIVPPKFRELLNMGRVLVTNWHVFAPKSEHSEGGKSYAVVDKGEESNDAFALDRLGDLADRLPILVLNDEGHHCWRGKQITKDEKKKATKDLNKEQKDALEEEEDEARVWLSGLDRINNSGLIGKDENGKDRPGIITCIDLSATPFYLSNSGYPEGSPFPWLVSDFGLVDAIECGIVKVPRLPVKDDSGGKDDAGRPDPKYFRLWHNITENDLKPVDYISKGRPRPESIYKYAESALLTLASQWKLQFEKYKADAAGRHFIPPVMIVVCDNTELSEVFFRKISGEYEVETADEEGKTVTVKTYESSAVFPELANSEREQHTVRIDSKLLKQIETEEGESKDEAALRLREIIDTIGKRGGPGEQVRCIVSVSMLTEGWDASNVTHVLGVRAFGSQLLCEQVVGRGLRRMSYMPDPETKMLQPEYVDVYGIPFSLIPFKGKPKEKGGDDPTYHQVYAMDERSDYEIRIPNVESYVYSLREGGITCDVDELEGFVVDKEPVTVYLAPTRGYHDDETPQSDSGDFVKQTREEYYKSVRPQQVLFRLSQIILQDLLAGAEGSDSDRGKIKLLARHQLFPEILKIVQDYVASKVTFKEGVDVRELGLERYANLLRERIRDNILPAAASETSRFLPVLNSFEPFTTTANVAYQTVRPVEGLVKSHLNCAVWRSRDEVKAIGILEDLDCVEYFTPNDRQVGLLVPYEYEDNRYNYEPDFAVRLKNGLMVILEIKGLKGLIHNPDQVLAKNAAAKKWCEAVNNLGKYGKWAFEFCDDVSCLKKTLMDHAGLAEKRPFRVISATSDTAWKTCVPLVTLKAAASGFGKEQLNFSNMGDWEWVTWEGAPRFEEGMFISRVRGKSMEPLIPDDSYCLFKQPRGGTRQGKVVLVWHSGITDPHTSGEYTVKEYHSEKRGADEGEWRHARITLRPKNPDFPDIVLEPEEEGQVIVVAEFVGVVGDNGENK